MTGPPAAGRLLLVFVKAPRPGQVKTRLAAALGAQAAADLYRRMAEGVLARTAPRAGEYERLVCFAPADARAEIEAWLPAEALAAQQGEDLGARMEAAFATAFAGGARLVAVVGSDVPRLAQEHVRAAWSALESHDVALGPTPDGGYYLLGLREPRPSLFRDVPWGTGDVQDVTLERARAGGLSVCLLPSLRDVDTEEDLAAEAAFLPPSR